MPLKCPFIYIWGGSHFHVWLPEGIARGQDTLEDGLKAQKPIHAMRNGRKWKMVCHCWPCWCISAVLPGFGIRGSFSGCVSVLAKKNTPRNRIRLSLGWHCKPNRELSPMKRRYIFLDQRNTTSLEWWAVGVTIPWNVGKLVRFVTYLMI